MLNGFVLRLWLPRGPAAPHTHSSIKQNGYLSRIQAYKVELHWSVYAFLTISNTWDSSRPQTIFWWSLILLVTPEQLISGGNHYQSIINYHVTFVISIMQQCRSINTVWLNRPVCFILTKNPILEKDIKPHIPDYFIDNVLIDWGNRSHRRWFRFKIR